MKLDYNILWIDDKISSRPFKAIINKISSSLNEQFFNCEVKQAEDLTEFKLLFEKGEEYDIIITDFSLNEGSTGKEVIDYVRDNQHDFTEIFFYSANSDVKNIPLINKNRVSYYQLAEGNYKELEEEIKEVIRQTVKKFQSIVAMRGLIMQETSSLDTKMSNVVKSYIDNPQNADFIQDILMPVLLEMQANSKEKYDKALSGNLKKILKDNVLFNSFHKIYALGEILKKLGREDFSTAYKNEIILLRNQFAHAESHKGENGKIFFKSGSKDDELIFDEDKCREIRRDINKHKLNIDNLILLVG